MKKVLFTIVGTVAALGIGIFLFSWIGTVLVAVFSVFPYFSDAFSGDAGMNPWMAKFVAIAFTIASVYGFRKVFSLNSKKRKQGMVIVAATFSAFFLVMFLVSKDHNFNPRTGESTVNVSKSPAGTRIVPKSWNFDAVYGNRTDAANPNDVAEALGTGKISGTDGLPPPRELQNLKKYLESH